MAKAIDLPRNESGIKTVMDVLKQQFGDRFQTSASVREQHGHTTTWIANQMPDAVVFAKTTQEVSDIVKACAAHKVPVIAFGTGTSLEGHVNAAAGGISIDLSQMNKIIQVHSEDLDCVIQPGVTREDLNTHLRDQGLFFPIDPGANASLGGMAATRASGTNAVRYGTMKDNVLALEAVMADGRIIRTAQRAKKSSAGYDLTRLLVGSEGTLGIITEITLKLQGIPEAISSARCSFPSVDAACQTVMQVIQFGIPVARIELLDTLQVQACNAYSGLDLPETPLLLLEFHGSDSRRGRTGRDLWRNCGRVWWHRLYRDHQHRRAQRPVEGAAQCLLGIAGSAPRCQGDFDRCLRADLAAGGNRGGGAGAVGGTGIPGAHRGPRR